MALVLFDDDRARAWTPLTLTRLAGELMFGCLTLRERAEHFWGEACVGHIADPGLQGFAEPGAAPVLEINTLDSGPDTDAGGARILFLSRAVPDFTPAPPIDQPTVLTMEGQIVGWVLPHGADSPDENDLLNPDGSDMGLPQVDIPGQSYRTSGISRPAMANKCAPTCPSSFLRVGSRCLRAFTCREPSECRSEMVCNWKPAFIWTQVMGLSVCRPELTSQPLPGWPGQPL